MFSVSHRYPWHYAKVAASEKCSNSVNGNTIVITAPNDDKITFNIQAYSSHFGAVSGNKLFTEFSNDLTERDFEKRKMKIFISIWRVLGDSWGTYIGSIKAARKKSPFPSTSDAEYICGRMRKISQAVACRRGAQDQRNPRRTYANTAGYIVIPPPPFFIYIWPSMCMLFFPVVTSESS